MKSYIATIEEKIIRRIYVEGDNIEDAAMALQDITETTLQRYEPDSKTSEVIGINLISDNEAKDWK